MEVILELSGHPKANVKKVLIADTVVVGRSQKCGLQIASAAVSRRHCEIRVAADSVSVIDLGSSNGTFIDAKRLAPGDETPLPSGSRLNVGGVRFIVQYAAVAEPAAAAAPPPLAAIPTGDDVLLVEADESVELTNQSSLTTDEDLAPVSESDEEDVVALEEETVPSPEPPVETPIAVADEPVVAEEVSEAIEDSSLELDAAFDDEPDLEAMFADSPSPSAPARAGESVADSPDEDVPILEEDEDAAFSFLTDDDDDEGTQKRASSETEDSRLGDFLSQLGRD